MSRRCAVGLGCNSSVCRTFRPVCGSDSNDEMCILSRLRPDAWGRQSGSGFSRQREKVAGGSCWIEGRRGLKRQERGSALAFEPTCTRRREIGGGNTIVESFQHSRTSMGCSCFVTRDAPMESPWVEMAAYTTRLDIPLSVAVGRVMRTATCSQQLSCNDVDTPVTMTTSFGLKPTELVNSVSPGRSLMRYFLKGQCRVERWPLDTR